MKIHFATLFSQPAFQEQLNRAGARTLLLSYYDLRKYSREQLETYVKKAKSPSSGTRNSKPSLADPSYRKRRTMAVIRRSRGVDDDEESDQSRSLE